MNKGLKIEALAVRCEGRRHRGRRHPKCRPQLRALEDGSIKAQLGLPDMKLFIGTPSAIPAPAERLPRFSFADYNLTFEAPDKATFALGRPTTS